MCHIYQAVCWSSVRRRQRSVTVLNKLYIVAILVVWLWGCSSLSPVVESKDVQDEIPPGLLPEGQGWWYARFHVNWPEGEEIRWYMGSLIGGEVIAQIFDEYYQDVYIWRVHRRAVRDDYGHVFSFIFYSTPQGAQRIFNAIENHKVVKSLLESGQLSKVTVDDVTRITRPNIEDTSDERWPESVQKTWPAMVMGTSRMWLDLVSELASNEIGSDGIEANYKNVHMELTRIWRENGQSALLHHLNAIYAYQPLLMRY
jgi:hypothetical protein